MSWLDRRDAAGAEPGGAKADEPQSQSSERRAPGIAALFEGVPADRSLTILDLGLGTGRHLSVLGPYTRRVRFAGLVPDPPRGAAWSAALESLPRAPRHSWDIVLAWDVFDSLNGTERDHLVGWLTRTCSATARLYLIADPADRGTTRPLRHQLLDLERVAEEPVGDLKRIHEPLLPAQVERLVDPFQVVRAFTLKSGRREYVAVR